MKKISQIVILFFFFSCSGNEEVDTEDIIKPSEKVKSVQTLNDFFGNWNLAVKINGEWWHVKGCDTYSLNISETEKSPYKAEMVMGDRIGLSADLFSMIKEAEIEKDGKFEFVCYDQYMDDKEVKFSGIYHQDIEGWDADVIDVDEGYFMTQLLSEVQEETEELRLFRPTTSLNFPDKKLEIECIVESDFDFSIEDIVPVGGLSNENISNDLMFQLIQFYGGEMSAEQQSFEFISIMEYFVFVQDTQDGDYSEMSFYSVNSNGVLLDKRQYTGVFEWIENTGKYEVDGKNNIICYPGDWVPDEENEIVNLVTTKKKITINEYGKFIDV